VNWSAGLAPLVWPATVTATSTVPPPAGLVAMQLVELAQLTPVAAALPKLIDVAVGLKLLPLIVTTVPPAAGPPVGVIPLTEGAGGGGGAA
jgi:hypothetical protein